MKRMSVSVFAALLIGALEANALEAGVGVGAYGNDPSGTAMYKGDKFDIAKDAGLKGKTSMYAWGYVEHPIPLLPNLRVDYSPFSDKATSDVDFTFDNKTFGANATTELQFDRLGIIAYYELPVPLIDIDVGIGADIIDGYISVAGGSQKASTDFSAPLPYLYGQLRFDIPSTTLGLEAALKWIGYDQSSFHDIRAKVDWVFLEAGLDIGIEAGYRNTALVLKGFEGVDVELDFAISGIYGGAFARF
jgi:outer membrane protein